MATPQPIQVHLSTPLPVTVHGQIPVTANSAIPVVAASPFPLTLQNPDSTLAWVTAGIALATLCAVGYQIWLSRRELQVVEDELKIIARSARLSLRPAKDNGDGAVAVGFWRQTEGRTRFFVTMPLRIVNDGNRGIDDAVIYWWLPPDLTPNLWSEDAPMWKQEVLSIDIGGITHELWMYRLDVKLYPKPFQMHHSNRFVFDDGRPTPSPWPPTEKPKPTTIYWQIVCDDGTFPDSEKPSALPVRFM
jgi:hypothetical protein